MTKATSDASHLPVPTGSTSPSNSIAPSTNPIDDHAPTPTYRDIQRAALGDLVELAKECAATENDIEVKFAATNEQITKENETALWSSNQRHKSTEEQILEKAGERSGRLAVKRKSELHKLASAANAIQDKIRQEFEPQARKYRQKYDQAVWLAESVLDSTQAQLQVELKTRRIELTEQVGQLRQREAEAAKTMHQYRIKIPYIADDTATSDIQASPVAPATTIQIGESRSDTSASTSASASASGSAAVSAELESAATEADAVNTSTESTPTDLSLDLAIKTASAAVTNPVAAALPVMPADADGDFASARSAAETSLNSLSSLVGAKMVVGPFPYVIALTLALAGGAGMQLFTGKTDLQIKPIAIGAGVGLALAIIIIVTIRLLAVAKATRFYKQFAKAIIDAHTANDWQLKSATETYNQKLSIAQKQRETEVHTAKASISPILAKLKSTRDAQLQSAVISYKEKQNTLVVTHADEANQIESRKKQALAEAAQKKQSDDLAIAGNTEARKQQSQQGYKAARAALADRLAKGLASTQSPFEDRSGVLGQGAPDWDGADWSKWRPPLQFASVVRFGELQVNLRKVADSVPHQGDLQLALPPAYTVPAILSFPRGASFMVEAGLDARQDAMRVLQSVMTRLLTSLPAGRVRFCMIDPIGLGQNFAGFMHLADFDDMLVTSRIWTDGEQINQRLVDLTDHMQTVIQKYLRNEFETIDDYNAQAGELAEPYRFLVIADFPINFDNDALRRLSSIAASGARCGVYLLIARDTRQHLAGGTHLDDLISNCVTISHRDGAFHWNDDTFKQFPLTIDPPPSEEALTRILLMVGKYAKDARRVEVPFDTIAPKVSDFWTLKANEELKVPIGRMGATRLQMMKLGKGVAQHTIIAGKTGSGKSTLLHALVTNVAMWYSPDEVELYLIDFKKGVEFKTYATHNLPHARAIAVESDREFGLSVLQRLDAELSRRGDMYRKLGVQDLNAFRSADPDTVMPRTLLIIDEFQEFFTEDDKLAQEAALLLDRLVRQGRAFGVHVLLGSQTIGGSSGLGRSTIGQMAVRVALQTSEADSQLILGDGNSAARLLSRPGEAIYNDQGGLVEGNSPFQVAWLPDEGRDIYLERVNVKLKEYQNGQYRRPPFPIVFEGNAPANIRTNGQLAALVASPNWPASTNAPGAWLGDPVAIREANPIIFRRQSGANLIVIGQQEESAMSMMFSSVISLATQFRPGQVQFHIMDGNAADSPYFNMLSKLKELIPHQVELVDFRNVGDSIHQIATEVARRQAGEENGPTIFLMVYGLQRYRTLRKSEDSFSFGGGEADSKPKPEKQFVDILREGPSLGVHVITWIDTPAAIDRTFERNTMREFDNRVLFQMSAADSSNLIDSPAANKLGFYRALAYSEEQGVMEKFRPYAMMDQQWMDHLKAKLAGKV